MVLLRVQVNCFRCRKPVDKVRTRMIKTINQKICYECFDCFTRNKSSIINVRKDKLPHKCSLYCERCKYKFQSNKLVCPYCNLSSFISKGNYSIKDLI